MHHVNHFFKNEGMVIYNMLKSLRINFYWHEKI